MMNLNIQETIDGLESVNRQLGFGHGAIWDAIKICEMWRKFRSDNGNVHIYFATEPDKSIKELMSKTKEEYFPSTVGASYKIRIESTSMDKVRNIVDCIQNTVGVKEVRNVVK